MGICLNNSQYRINEILVGSRPIPIKIINKVMKSICKIIIKKKESIAFGTGFFLNYSEHEKYLMTCYHNINPSLENETIEIVIYNDKKMKLNFKNRLTKYLDKPKDIAMIELKEWDEIYNDIEFLNYDYNYIKYGYSIYEKAYIFSVGHPCGDDAACDSGMIKRIDEYEFEHDISTDKGSSGCPIILLTNNINLIQVIGIHKEADFSKQINIGTFLGEILKEQLLNNYIIAEINIEEKDVNKDIRIINSLDECLRKFPENPKFTRDDKYKNEKEIKNCEIRINKELIIPFNYEHKFKEKGKYIIKYIFKKNLENICLMFYRCTSLTKIDLTNINTDNVTYINGLFSGCSSLTNIDLSNFKTNKVTDMGFLFRRCSSLTNINLSNFNTDNVTGMFCMFSQCSSLNNVDLSNFNTNNVINMFCMFEGCSSLTNVNLSNFNIDNVIDMNGMFSRCKLLRNENIIIQNKDLFNHNEIFHEIYVG